MELVKHCSYRQIPSSNVEMSPLVLHGSMTMKCTWDGWRSMHLDGKRTDTTDIARDDKVVLGETGGRSVGASTGAEPCYSYRNQGDLPINTKN